MAEPTPPDATALAAAWLSGLDLDALGLPPDRWADAGLAALGVDLDRLAAALRSEGPVSEPLARVTDLIGDGTPTPPRGSPFGAVRLLGEGEQPSAPQPAERGPLATLAGRRFAGLDDLGAAVLRAVGGAGLAAPGAADVPLVDQIRVRVALVAALSQGDADADAIYWVAGDLSGIQSYLYDIADIGAGGVARRLRARSLFLQLLAEDSAERLRRHFALPRASVLMRSGGAFHLFLPDTDAARAALADEQSLLDRWLLDQTHGEVALVLTGRRVTLPRLMADGAGAALAAVGADLGRAKAARFAAALRPAGAWSESAFLRAPLAEGADACRSCHKQAGEQRTADGDLICRVCAEQTEAGRALPHARAVVLHTDTAAAGARLTLPEGVASFDAVPPGGALLTISTDQTAAPGEPTAGAYIPVANGAPLTFEQMIERGRGRSLLGYLKMDVDRLGEIFAFGLRGDDGGLDTLPRLAALSRLLDAFFSRRLPILIRERFPHCYQVYAGGDDVLVIGPWWETLGLAQAVRAAFREWAAENPEITISAGLAVTQFRTPVAIAAHLADAALEAAKHGTPEPGSALLEARRRRGHALGAPDQPAPAPPCVPVGPDGARGRDCVALLGEVLSWDHLALAIGDVERLAPERPPAALLHRLLAFAGMWQEFRDGDPGGLRLFPFLAYELRRTIDPRRQPLLAAWATSLGGAAYRDGEQHAPLEHLGLVARLLLLLAEGDRR